MSKTFLGASNDFSKIRKRSEMPEPNCVYLLSGYSYGHSGFFKVGITSNLRERVRQISRSVPFEISLSVAVRDENPLQLESDFIGKYGHYLVKGEWFCVLPSLKIDPSKCSFREYMKDFLRQSKSLEKVMKNDLVLMSSGGKIDALL